MASNDSDTSQPDLLTYEEAAALLGIGVGAVKSAIAKGKLRPIRIAGSTRKYLERSDVLAYPERRNARIPGRKPEPPVTLDAAQLRELAMALSGPSLEALREAHETTRQAINGLAQIAIGVVMGASGASAQGMMPHPKRITG